jgi:hypothetical protein
LNKLKDQLAKEDQDQQKAGVVFPHQMSPSVFLQQALEVEVAQYVCIVFGVFSTDVGI